MCRTALGLAVVVSALLAGCMSVESGGGVDSKQPSPDNQGCPGCYGRVAPPPTLSMVQDGYGRPYPIAPPWSSNPPGNNWLALQKLNSSQKLPDGYYGGVMVANGQAVYPPGGPGAGYPPMPVPRYFLTPPGMAPVPGMPPKNDVMQAGGPGAAGAAGIQQAQYVPGNYPPPGGYPAPNGARLAGPSPNYYPYPAYYNPYPGYSYPPTTTGAAGPPRPNFAPVQQMQFSPNTSGNYVPPAARFNQGGASPFGAPGMGGPGMGAMPGGGMGGPGMGSPGNCGTVGGDVRTQVRFVRPVGMKVHWYTMGPDGRPMYSNALRVPGSYNFPQGAIYRLKLSNIDQRPEMDLYPTMEVFAGSSKTEAFLSHSAVPVEFTAEDFKQISEGNYVVKVIYLPDPQFQDVAGTGTDEILSTRLEPGADPIKAARDKGTVLLVIRMGNLQQELDNTPPLNAPGRAACGPQGYGPQGCGPNIPGGVPGGMQQPHYGSPGQGGGFGPGFGLGGNMPGGPPTTMQRQLIQVPFYNDMVGRPPQSGGGYANPQNCPQNSPQNCPPNCPPGGYYQGGACPPGMTPGTPYMPGYYPAAPGAPAPKTSQANPPATLPPSASAAQPMQVPEGDKKGMPTSLPASDLHESKSSPVGTGREQQPAATEPQPSGPPPGSLPKDVVPQVLPETQAPSSSTMSGPPPGTAVPPPPVTVDGPNGPLSGPPPEADGSVPPSTPSTPPPGETAKPMGTQQMLPPTPGLADVAPPAAKPAQPALPSVLQNLTPALPDNPSPIAPAPGDAPKLPPGEAVGRPGGILRPSTEEPSLPMPAELPPIPPGDAAPPPSEPPPATAEIAPAPNVPAAPPPPPSTAPSRAEPPLAAPPQVPPAITVTPEPPLSGPPR